MKYNIYKLEEEGPAFTVNVATFRSRTNRDRCDLRTIEVCARSVYLPYRIHAIQSLYNALHGVHRNQTCYK